MKVEDIATTKKSINRKQRHPPGCFSNAKIWIISAEVEQSVFN